MRTIIQNGTIVSDTAAFRADLLLEDGVVKAVGAGLSAPDAQVIDASGKYVLPGAVDVHTHMDLQAGAHRAVDDFYTGTVAGVTPRGIFVALENTVEGFVPAAQLCKGEATVVEGVSILDPLTGKRWMLGDPVKVQVAGANVALGRIDFDYMPL